MLANEQYAEKQTFILRVYVLDSEHIDHFLQHYIKSGWI